jgi:hypothetical protein
MAQKPSGIFFGEQDNRETRNPGGRIRNARREEKGFLHSTFDIRDSEFPKGGIAQLVERQLCKLEVRGSNPLASISKEMEAEMRTQFDWWGALRARVTIPRLRDHSPEPKPSFG